ncbi:hypothetical protein BESB_011380 [Besnoitia besnoiti]|uniref:Uncharacterized protein n=1 Tax=Besnoitia besnoiti TaxID=94643 RepID=A0A2A9MQH0_BESBE|nr:hypothetical protein BESB_011380 [Besnoitia besnoiti]PFH38796.1 hypothetical protein BESB_011380 [Besnoitia besnoiti]
MQRTCDEVYANMPTDVASLAALAYSVRMRQTYLFRLLQLFQEAEKRERERVRRGTEARAALAALAEDQRQAGARFPPSVYPEALSVSLPSVSQLSGAASSSVSSPAGSPSSSPALAATGVPLGSATASSLAWRSRVLGAAPLLPPCGLGDELEGEWTQLAAGLWSGKGLFGDGIDFLQAAHELLSDWSFLWAMPCEAEPVWLKLAAFASRLQHLGMPSLDARAPPSSSPQPVSLTSPSSGSAETGEAADRAAAAGGVADLPARERGESEKGVGGGAQAGDAEVAKGESPKEGQVVPWQMRFQRELETEIAKRARLAHARQRHTQFAAPSHSPSAPSEALAYEMQQRAGEEESEAEWLSLPRTLVALEHLYCRAAHEFCRAPQHAVEQFVRTRPRDFIMLMLVSSFPPPSRRVHTPPPPALAASTSSSLKPALSSLLLPPSSVSTSQRLASSCFIPCRHPAAPPLFFQFQNLIPRLPPLRQDERDDRGVYVAALTLLAVRWRWVCAWASDTSQAANARGPSPVLPLLRFEHFMKAVSVIYSEALYAARLLLPHQQERYLLLQQLLRHLNYTPHNRITLQQLATQGGPRAAANVVCMLAATRDMHAATGLRHSLFEVLSSLLSKLFVKGIFFWPSRSTGAPFLPYPLALSSTRELLPPSEPASSGSSCFSSRPVRVGEVVFPPSPVTLLPYLHLVALDSAQARSVNPRDSYLRRLIRLYQVFFEAALRTPGKEGAGPRQLLTRESPLQPALTAASSASAGGDIVQTAASTPDARVRAASEKRKRQTEGGAASAEGKEARPSEKNDANEEDISTLYGLTEAAFHRSWAVPLVLQADVDRALHLPLLLPHLLNIWKEKLDARRYSALRSLLFRSSSPKDQADGGAEGPYVEASRDSLVANAEEAPHPGKRHSAPQVAQEFDDGYASEEETKNAHLRITPTAASSAAPSTKPLSPELAVSTLVLFLCRAARIPLPEQLQAPQPAAEAAARRRAEKNLQDEHARDPATGAVADIGGEISAGSSKQASRVEKEEASAAESKPEKEMTAEGSREAASSSNAAAGLRDEARLSGGEQTNETSSSVLFEEDDDADLSLASLSFDADGNLFIPAEEGGSDEAEQTTAPSKKGKKNQVREGTPPASAPTADTASSSPTEPYTIEATQGELEKEAANTDAHDEVEDVFATSHTLDPSRFAEPLRHLTLTTLATGMTVLDEELQCVNEVVHRVNAKFPAAQAAEAEELVAKDSFLAACFRPFPSLASYQAALSALYDVFDFLFVEKLSACSVAELQLLALNTRRLIKLPRYLPFPSRDDGRSPAAGEPSAGSTPEDEATRAQEDGETFERRGEAEPMRTVSGEDLERARNGGERADARLPVSRETERHEPQVLQARRWADATRDRREFFYGSIMQALVLRLTKLNAALQCHSSPSASSARGEEAATDAHQQVRTAPAGRTREATSLQEEQAVALFELLLHMLAGSPLPVQRELLLLLLQRSGVAAEVGASTAADAEESDGLRSVVGSSHPQSASEGDPLSENHKLLLHIGKPFELLLRDIASMSESQLFRLALAIARLDLLGCLFDAHPEGGRRRGSVAAADLACFSSTAPFLAPRAFSLPAATLAGAGDAKHLVDPDAAQPEKTQLLESDSSRRGADTGCSSSRALSANLHLLLAPETTHGAPCEAPEAGEPPEHRRLRKQQARQERTRRDEKRRAARLLQRELEGALRAKLAFGWETLSFSEATGLLWALTVMPEPKLDLLVLLFDRIESSFNVVLEEQRIIEQPTDLPSHLPPLTSGPIYRFLATHTPVDSARLRSACAALLREGDPAVVSSLQARFPLCWVALEVLASTRFHQERSVFADSSAASNIERTLEEDERAGEWDDAHGDSAKHPRASAVVTPLAQSVIRMAQTKHGISLLWDTDFQIPGLPFIFDLALPNERIVFLLGSHCASLPLEEGSSSYDSLSCISGLEPDLVVATPTLPLVVQSGDEATQEGGERAVQWELAECVVGPPRSGMNEIGEQKQRFRDAGSCGGRRLIRRLTEQAGYRLIEIDTPDATHAETLLDRLLTSSAGERVSRAHVATPLKAGGVPLPR